MTPANEVPVAPVDVPSSPHNAVGDALQSYAHSQSLVASSRIASSPSLSQYAAGVEDDEEATVGLSRSASHDDADDEDDFEDDMPTPTRETPAPAFVADIAWDDDDNAPSASRSESTTPRALSLARASSSQREKRPLLPASGRRTYHAIPPAPLAARRPSTTTKYVEDIHGGAQGPRKSTFSQSLFNSMAILLGIGLLSEPLAFSYAGWIGGTILIVFYGWLTCYTAKILAKLIREDASLRTYTDIARKAFGARATGLTSALFFLELFTLSVVFVTLFADSLHEVLPTYSSNTYKALAIIVLLPTAFLPLSLLSYASLVGVVSTLFIICVVVYDGLTKLEAPGSIWEPAETVLGVPSSLKLALAFGLFMAGFSGHAVIPSLALDMEKPEEFDRVMNIAFTATTFLYALMGAAGYLMFGSAVSEEISQDLMHTPGYSTSLNALCVWMLVIVPLTKFALVSRPLNITIELALGLEHRTVVAVERATVVAVIALTAVLVPDFSASVAFLGSFSAFVLCVVGPIAAKMAVERRVGALDAVLLAISCAMAATGTIAAFFASAE